MKFTPALLTMLTLVCPVALPAAETRPNIVFILLDDAGCGDLGCYGQTKFQTPNIDRLAAEGMRFTRHYSGSTVCAPTRCVLMTGLHTGHCPIRGNSEVQPEGQPPLPADVITLPELLKQAGYTTGAFGKWGLGFPGSEGDPMHQGFDVFFGYNCQRQAHNYYPDHLWDNLKKHPLDGQTYSHTLILERALKFITDNREKPFFCYLPVTIPHASLHAPESYVDHFRQQFPQFADQVGKYKGPEVKNPVAAFAGMMTLLDEGIGQLLQTLKDQGLDDRTIVLLSSDNGPHREGGHQPEFFNSNASLRGFKRDLYEGGIRSPLIVRWPDHVPAGTTSDLLCAHWDLLPTFCELAGIKTPANLNGFSLTPTLLGQPEQQKQHPWLYWEFHEQGGKRAVRMGDWKAIQLNVNNRIDNPVELYNLQTDPAETNNVAASHPDIVRQAQAIFQQAHTSSKTWPFGVQERKQKN